MTFELREELERIAWELADGVIDEIAISGIVRMATRLHVVPVATGVLADTSAPYIVRCRAFGEVATAIAAVPTASQIRSGAA